jgi:hypothetical protein
MSNFLMMSSTIFYTLRCCDESALSGAGANEMGK